MLPEAGLDGRAERRRSDPHTRRRGHRATDRTGPTAGTGGSEIRSAAVDQAAKMTRRLNGEDQQPATSKLGKLQPPGEIVETGIGAQRIEHGHGIEPVDDPVALFVGPLQPFERVIVLAPYGVAVTMPKRGSGHEETGDSGPDLSPPVRGRRRVRILRGSGGAPFDSLRSLRTHQDKKRGPASRASFRLSWCGRGDSNPHVLANASPSSWCVCQFRHFRRGERETRIRILSRVGAAGVSSPGGAAGLKPRPTADLKVRPTRPTSSARGRASRAR